MSIPIWMKILSGIILFFLGASVYSFLNVVIFRVPRGEEFVKTRSHCPGCRRVLTPLELVPVVSYVCLGGKCKNCGSKIGIRDVLIEVFGGLSCIACFWIYFQGPTESLAEPVFGDFYARFLAGLTAFAFIGALTVITFIHVDMGVVKRGTLVALAVIAFIGFFTLPETLLWDRVIGALCLSLILVILSLLFRKIACMEAAWVMAIAGFLFGWEDMLTVALPGTVLTALVEVAVLLVAKKKPLSKYFRVILALNVGLLAVALNASEILRSLIP